MNVIAGRTPSNFHIDVKIVTFAFAIAQSPQNTNPDYGHDAEAMMTSAAFSLII